MDLNKNQYLFLVEISKKKGKTPVSRIGKKVWNTNVSTYNNMNMLKDMGYISSSRRKNMIIVEITEKGNMAISDYFEVAKGL